MDPSVLMHVRLLWQPPLFSRHSLISLQPFAPSLAYPDGQSPHFMDPSVLMHVRLSSQPPLLFRHSLTSLQPFAPSLAYPDGQSPHFMDPTVLMHVRLLWQPPLLCICSAPPAAHSKNCSRSTRTSPPTSPKTTRHFRAVAGLNVRILKVLLFCFLCVSATCTHLPELAMYQTVRPFAVYFSW